MEISAGILQALAAVTGKKYTADSFSQGTGEDKKPLSTDAIKKLIVDDYKAKHDGLGVISEEKKAKIEQAERKKVYEEIETLAKSEFDIDLKWTEQKFSPLKEYFEDKVKNTKIQPDDVKKSEAYIALKGEVKALKANQAQLISNHKQERIFDKVTGDLTSILGNTEYKFVVPQSETVMATRLETTANKMKTATYKGKPVKWDIVDGKATPRDSDGHPLYDDSGNEVTAKDIKLSVLKSVFDTTVAQPRGGAGAGDKSRQAGAAGGGSAKVITYQKDGKDVSYTPPVFSDKSAAAKYLNENAYDLDKEQRTAIRETINDLPDKVE